MASKEPLAVVVLSGKRKSGKDFISEKLQERLGVKKCELVRLSGPLKEAYAEEHKLDKDALMDASAYKEKYRKDMVEWGERKRTANPRYFCDLATAAAVARNPDAEVWIVTDARRGTDLEHFRTTYGKRCVAVRITADDGVRVARSFVFTPGVDDAETETGLDAVDDWDYRIANNDETGWRDEFDKLVADITERCEPSIEDLARLLSRQIRNSDWIARNTPKAVAP